MHRRCQKGVHQHVAGHTKETKWPGLLSKELVLAMTRTAEFADALDMEHTARDLDIVELCAGTAPISREGIKHQMKCESVDKQRGPNEDILTATGFRRTKNLVLRLKKEGLLWVSPNSGPWVWMSRAITGRSTDRPEGNEDVAMVANENKLAKRLVFLTRLARRRGAVDVWQTSGASLLPEYRPVQKLLLEGPSFHIKLPLCAYGSDSKQLIRVYGTAPFLPALWAKCEHKDHPNVTEEKGGWKTQKAPGEQLAYPGPFSTKVVELYRQSLQWVTQNKDPAYYANEILVDARNTTEEEVEEALTEVLEGEQLAPELAEFLEAFVTKRRLRGKQPLSEEERQEREPQWLRLKRFSEDRAARKKEMRQLHVNTGHPQVRDMVRFLRNTGGKGEDEVLAQEVYDECVQCAEVGYPAGPPVASLPRAYAKNEMVSIDHYYIPQRKGIGFLLVDVGSKVIAAAWVQSKKPSETVNVILEIWIYPANGAPFSILVDADPCFHNPTFYAFLVKYSIKLLGVAPDAQWANPAERWIQTFKLLVAKMALTNPKAKMKPLTMAAAHAVNAKMGPSGNTALQRHYGTQPRLPSLLTSDDTALCMSNAESPSGGMLEVMDYIWKSQRCLMDMECDIRIRRVLSTNLRLQTGYFHPGDLVQVWRKYPPPPRWKFVGAVLGHFGKEVVIWDGTRSRHAHQNYVQKKRPHFKPIELPMENQSRIDDILVKLRKKNPDVDRDGNLLGVPDEEKKDDDDFPKPDDDEDDDAGDDSQAPDTGGGPRRRRRRPDHEQGHMAPAGEQEQEQEVVFEDPMEEEFTGEVEVPDVDGLDFESVLGEDEAERIENFLDPGQVCMSMDPDQAMQMEIDAASIGVDNLLSPDPDLMEGQEVPVGTVNPFGIADRPTDRLAVQRALWDSLQGRAPVPAAIGRAVQETHEAAREQAGLRARRGASQLQQNSSSAASPGEQPAEGPRPPGSSNDGTSTGLLANAEERKDRAYMEFLGLDHREAYATWKYLWYQSELRMEPEVMVTMKQLKSRVVPPRLAIGPEWDKARLKEWTAWEDNKAFQWRKRWELPNEPLVDHLWVYTRKDDCMAKARCTLRGDQEKKNRKEWYHLDIPTDAPTAHKEDVRLFCTVTVEKAWEAVGGDVPTAFLQQEPGALERRIPMKPPHVPEQGGGRRLRTSEGSIRSR